MWKCDRTLVHTRTIQLMIVFRVFYFFWRTQQKRVRDHNIEHKNINFTYTKHCTQIWVSESERDIRHMQTFWLTSWIWKCQRSANTRAKMWVITIIMINIVNNVMKLMTNSRHKLRTTDWKKERKNKVSLTATTKQKSGRAYLFIHFFLLFINSDLCTVNERTSDERKNINWKL